VTSYELSYELGPLAVLTSNPTQKIQRLTKINGLYGTINFKAYVTLLLFRLPKFGISRKALHQVSSLLLSALCVLLSAERRRMHTEDKQVQNEDFELNDVWNEFKKKTFNPQIFNSAECRRKVWL
jgi:hypothetical protein